MIIIILQYILIEHLLYARQPDKSCAPSSGPICLTIAFTGLPFQWETQMRKKKSIYT